MESPLYLRRQFILSPAPVKNGNVFISHKIHPEYYLHRHPDLPFAETEKYDRKLYVLGNIFDPFHPDFTNEDIISGLAHYPVDQMLKKCDDYSGRYAIICYDENNFKLFHDFMSHFKVYWTCKEGRVWCGSQPHILAKELGIPKTSDRNKRDFFNSPVFKRSEYVDLFRYTLYDEIEHLQPNHCLDLLRNRTERYWPSENIKKKSRKTVVSGISSMLTGYLRSASKKYDLMIPVTAGFDSRLLLAASKDISDKCLYYINKNPGMNERSPDIRIPRKLLSLLGKQLIINEYREEVDPEFETLYRLNCQVSFMQRLPLIYNVYYQRYQPLLNVPANGAEAFLYRWWPGVHNEIDAFQLAKVFRYERFPFFTNVISEWLAEVKPYCKRYQIDLSNILYLEYRMANWATQFQVNKDIAQDEFFPFNSRRLVQDFLSINPYFRQVNSRFIMKKLMRILWKETLNAPVNPSLKNHIKHLIDLSGFALLLKRK